MSQAPEIHRFSDTQELIRAAAGLFLEVGRQAITERNRFLVALSGGSTPKALYSILASEDYAQQLDWSKVHFLFGDERSVPPTHADSNFAMADAILFSPLHIPSAQIHRMRGEDPPETAAAQYETTLRHLTAAVPGQWPRLDLVLLGMGDDGHTASLFPASPNLDAALQADCPRRCLPMLAPGVPYQRLSLTLPLLASARVPLLAIQGQGKLATLREALNLAEPASMPIRAFLHSPLEIYWCP